MKRFIDKKYTVNIALAIVAVFGIIIGIVTASIGSEMVHTSAEQLALSKGGNGCSGIRINPCYVENANDAEEKIEKAEDEPEQPETAQNPAEEASIME